MKKKTDDVLVLIYSISMASFLIMIAVGGFEIIKSALQTAINEGVSRDTILKISGGLGIISFSLIPIFVCIRMLLTKREILIVPQEVRWDASRDEKYPLDNKLRMEVLRHGVPDIFPGWQICKNREKQEFDIIRKEFEFVSYPEGTKIRETAVHLSELDKFIIHYGFAHDIRLFSGGKRIGWRKTTLDRILFLGPQYLIAFPSGFIIATHMNGLQSTTSV